MSTALADRLDAPLVTSEQLDLIKRTVASGATDAELKLFLYDCTRRGIHPLDRLLHFTKRGGRYTPVTSIDFMRSQAAMSGEMAGSDDAVFEGEGPDDHLFRATVTVYRLTQGQRFAYGATARWREYCPDNAQMWRRMPNTMLAKCAEALALRKAFPQQLAGLYATEELDQAEKSGFVVEAPVASRGTSSPTEPLPVPSDPNGETSGVPDTRSPVDRELPDGTVLIRKVEEGSGKAKAFLHTHKTNESYAIYADALVTLATELCQEGKPVVLTVKTAASGKAYVTAIRRLALPEAWKPFAHEPPPIKDEDLSF